MCTGDCARPPREASFQNAALQNPHHLPWSELKVLKIANTKVESLWCSHTILSVRTLMCREVETCPRSHHHSKSELGESSGFKSWLTVFLTILTTLLYHMKQNK